MSGTVPNSESTAACWYIGKTTNKKTIFFLCFGFCETVLLGGRNEGVSGQCGGHPEPFLKLVYVKGNKFF